MTLTARETGGRVEDSTDICSRGCLDVQQQIDIGFSRTDAEDVFVGHPWISGDSSTRLSRGSDVSRSSIDSLNDRGRNCAGGTGTETHRQKQNLHQARS